MNKTNLLKEYENMTVEQKDSFNALIHTVTLFAKINGHTEDEAYNLINNLFKSLSEEIKSDSTISTLAKTIDITVLQCKQKLEKLSFNPEPNNFTHRSLII